MMRPLLQLVIVLVLSAAFAAAQVHSVRKVLSLDGVWQFQTDPQRVGDAHGWANGLVAFARMIEVPGAWQAQGVGEPRGFLRNDYVGLAWYRRDVTIPADWRGKAVTMHFGGSSRLTRLYVNGQLAGTHDGFSTPFEFDVTDFVRPGAMNHFVIAVDNNWPRGKPKIVQGRDISKPVGFLVYAANWGGLYAPVELVAHSDPYIGDAYVLPDIAAGIAHVHIDVRSRKAAGVYRITAEVSSAKTRLPAANKEVSVAAGADSAETIDVRIPGAHLWTPEDPYLYQVSVQLSGNGAADAITRHFGMREFTTDGERLLLNGKPYFLRGYGDLDIEPFTGVPPVSVSEFVQRLQIAKQYGFNYVRLHSRMPPPEMLKAADRVGVLISYELPVVYAPFLLPHREFLGKELARMVKVTRGHPSVFSLDMGNEMDPETDFDAATRPQMLALLHKFYLQAKALDPSLIVFGSDGFDIPPSDIASMMRGIVPGKVNIAHEFGGYPCSLPNPALIPQFTGYMVPYWLFSARQWVRENRLEDIYPSLVRASERVQWESHKFKIERLRETTHFSGYQLWAITDAPSGIEGGPWEEGVLDYFWHPKSVDAASYREFQAPSILLIDRKPGKRTFWLDRGTTAAISLSHYGAPLRHGVLHWLATDAVTGSVLNTGIIQDVHADPGQVVQLGKISFGKTSSARPLHLKLQLDLVGADLHTSNEWSFWGYPEARVTAAQSTVASLLRKPCLATLYPWIKTGWPEQRTPDVLIASEVSPQVYNYVLAGGKAIIFLKKTDVDRPLTVNYFPDFVNMSPRAWGTRIEPSPFSSAFVQSGFMDMQFYNLMQDAYGFDEQWLTGAERCRLHPLMWGVKTVPGGLQKLGFVYQFRAGKGTVMLVSLNVEHNLDTDHPAALYFFDQALRYVLSSKFAPRDELTPKQFSQLAFVAYR